MDINDLNIELNKYRKRRQNLDNHLIKRQKLINYFKAKKEIHLNLLKKAWLNGSITLISSLLFLSINPIFSYLCLSFTSCFLSLSFYKLYVCNKFNKTIKKIEENNVKFVEKMHELLLNELELDNQIKNLSAKELVFNKNVNKSNCNEENNKDLSI